MIVLIIVVAVAMTLAYHVGRSEGADEAVRQINKHVKQDLGGE